MINDTANNALDVLQSCRCCLLRPPDRGLKTPYTHRDQTEVYSDMIEECFDIHLTLDNEECGICEACVVRLRDARGFKLQVQRSQAELQAGWARMLRVKVQVKAEMSDDAMSDENPISHEDFSVKSEMDDSATIRDDGDFTLNEERPAKSETGDAMSDGDPISLSCDGCAPALLEPARAAAARAREQLAMACSVRLERLRDDKAPHASPTCRQTFRHEATLAAHARGHARPDAGPGEEARGASAAHAGEDTYTCDYCGEHLTAKISLIKHIRKHMTKTPDTGEICSKALPTKYFLTQHEVHANGKLYACDICNKQFTRKSNLKYHIRIHTGHRPYACDLCNKQFTVKGDDGDKHIKIHLKPFACDYCLKKFTHSHLLKRHRRIHTGEKPFACEICEKQFTQRGNLQRHIGIHTGLKPYACDVCNKQFTLKRYLKKHVMIHTRQKSRQKSYACDICSKKFIHNCNLTRHRRIHTGERPFHCEKCNQRFSIKSNFIIHKRIHTGDKPYTCDTCGKQFTDKGSLKRHIIIHGGERPHSCEYCLKKFARRSVLTRHLLIHTGEKPFGCEECDKRFIRKSQLTRHNRIHTGENSYASDLCEKKFTHKRSLKAHIRLHTARNPYFCKVCNEKFPSGAALKQHKRIHNEGDLKMAQ